MNKVKLQRNFTIQRKFHGNTYLKAWAGYAVVFPYFSEARNSKRLKAESTQFYFSPLSSEFGHPKANIGSLAVIT